MHSIALKNTGFWRAASRRITRGIRWSRRPAAGKRGLGGAGLAAPDGLQQAGLTALDGLEQATIAFTMKSPARPS